MSLKVNWIETYLDKGGMYNFVYLVSGSSSELNNFKEKQVRFYKETPDGKPKYTIPWYKGKSGDLILNYYKTKYFIESSKLMQAESIAKQYGGELCFALAKQTGDINWLLHFENTKITNFDQYEETINKQNVEYESLKKIFSKYLNQDLTNEIKKQDNNYFEEGMKENTGLTFLNEWHFAADVVNKIKDAAEILYSILEKPAPEKSYFSGILQDQSGNKYDIREDENIWMFEQLLFIFNLKIVCDFDKMTLKLGKNITPN